MTENNKIFEKADFMAQILQEFIPDGIILSKTTQDWHMRRKALSSTLYKEKLIKMIEVTKDVVKERFAYMRENFAKTGKEMDLVNELVET